MTYLSRPASQSSYTLPTPRANKRKPSSLQSTKKYQLNWDVFSDQVHKTFIMQPAHSQRTSHPVTQASSPPTSLVMYVNIGFTHNGQRDNIARLPAIMWNSLHGLAHSYSFRHNIGRTAVHWATLNWTLQTAVPVQTEQSGTKITRHSEMLRNND
jgi:hypothetical protein